MALRRIALHYDCISPYSWIGFELMMRHGRMWNDPSVQIELKPTFLGGIMKGSGNKPPGVVPGKMVYMGRDIHRLNDFTGSKIILFVHLPTTFSGAEHAFRSFHNTLQKRLDQSDASDYRNGYDKP